MTNLLELRRISGLSWDELSRVFGVDRRSLHFWASGKRPNPVNEERLQRLLAAMRCIDRGTAAATRAVLLAPLPDGTLPYDLLCAEQFDRAVALVGEGRGRVQPVPPALSAQARAARRPRPPTDLLVGLQAALHKDEGRLLGAVAIRTKRE